MWSFIYYVVFHSLWSREMMVKLVDIINLWERSMKDAT